MRQSEKRLRDLEARSPSEGIDWSSPCHRIIVQEGQTLRESVEAYGAEKIGSRDRAVVRKIISPCRDEGGTLIAQPKAAACISDEEWREACGR
jgi:hypothetical protein